MTPTKTVAVAAICHGTVIDHIKEGSALAIVKWLRLSKHHKQVTLGLNLPSDALGYKDLIKVEDRELTPDEANQVAILAPDATINIIKDFQVVQKFRVSLPKRIEGFIKCPNPQCITHSENIPCTFKVMQRSRRSIRLECHYCEKTFSQAEIG